MPTSWLPIGAHKLSVIKPTSWLPIHATSWLSVHALLLAAWPCSYVGRVALPLCRLPIHAHKLAIFMPVCWLSSRPSAGCLFMPTCWLPGQAHLLAAWPGLSAGCPSLPSSCLVSTGHLAKPEAAALLRPLSQSCLVWTMRADTGDQRHAQPRNPVRLAGVHAHGIGDERFAQWKQALQVKHPQQCCPASRPPLGGAPHLRRSPHGKHAARPASCCVIMCVCICVCSVCK